MTNRSSLVGDIPEDWQLLTIGQLCEITGGSVQTGPFGSQLHAEDYVAEGTPVVMPNNLGKNRIEVNEITRVSDKDAKRLERHRLEPGDIVFPRRGDLSRYAHVSEEYSGWLCGTGCLRIRLIGGDFDTGYLAYYLGHPQVQSWIEGNAVGTTMLNLNTSIMKALPVAVPPIHEQRRIAETLKSLDDKIEVNRRMNATLETTTRAIFKSWFVNFDPAHAKAHSEQPANMDAETAVLFADSFEESVLGLIPDGWSIVPIGDHVTARKGLSYKGDGLASTGEGLPMHNLDSVLEFGGYKYQGIKWYTGEYKPRHTLSPGEVIVANTEQGFDLLLIGSAAIVPSYFGRLGLFSHHIYKLDLKPSSPLTSRFLYYLINSQRFRATIQGYTNGTTVNMLPSDAFEKPVFVLPPRELVKRFDEIVAPMITNQESIYAQTQTLVALRDTLIPKLVCGEIRVED